MKLESFRTSWSFRQPEIADMLQRSCSMYLNPWLLSQSNKFRFKLQKFFHHANIVLTDEQFHCYDSKHVLCTNAKSWTLRDLVFLNISVALKSLILNSDMLVDSCLYEWFLQLGISFLPCSYKHISVDQHKVRTLCQWANSDLSRETWCCVLQDLHDNIFSESHTIDLR